MSLTLDNRELHTALTLTAFSTCKSGTGTNKGILIESTSNQELCFVSTDNIRMSIYQTKTLYAEKDEQFILDISDLKSLLCEIKPRSKVEEYPVCLNVKGDTITFDTPFLTSGMTVKGIPGKFADWCRFLPNTTPSSEHVGDNHSINISYLADLAKALGKTTLPKNQTLYACKVQACNETGPRYISTGVPGYYHIIMPMRG